MVKKTTRLKRIDRKRKKSRRRKSPSPDQMYSGLGRKLLSVIARQQKPVKIAEILELAALPRHERGSVKRVLKEMVETGQIRTSKKGFTLAAAEELIEAKLDLTSKGFGFALVKSAAKEEKDIFLPAANLGGASHGDTILVKVTGVSRGRREGVVVKILTREITRLCGIFTANGQAGYLTPDNVRLPYTVTIGRGNTMMANDGMAVLVEITDYGAEGRGPEGKIIEILGDPTDARVQIRMAIIQHKLRTTFSPAVMEAAEALTPLTSCEKGRKDLRSICQVTIDGANARDFDDAIGVEKNGDGFTLYVSIADVSHYVRPGSPIDKEAYRRGTSVYLPDRVLPMLPERLSNNLCSLVPHQDRPAFTAILRFDNNGQRVAERYTKSLITSHNRFTYSTVNRLLYQKNRQEQEQHAELMPMLENAKRLAALLHKRRMERGSLGFNLPESVIEMDKDQVKSISLADRNQAHMLIEECMLAANEAVAETLAKRNKEVLFRIHEDPDQEKLAAFVDMAKSLGLQLPKTEMSPAWFAGVLAEADDSPAGYVINNLLLRTMQQARYSPDNSGHFGLAAQYYLHFTSPIRRYPDLIAHRVLQGLLTRDLKTVSPLGGTASMGEAALQLSKCERKAVDVERDVRARLAVLFLKDHIGDTFEAVISGVTGFGLFVELSDYYISGAVPVQSMTDDYYLHDEKRFQLIGEGSNKKYQLGQKVLVILDNVEIGAKRITFALVRKQDTTNSL